MMTEVATIQIEIPEPYYFIRYDYPRDGEWYLLEGKAYCCGANNGYGRNVIVGDKRKVPEGCDFVRYDYPKTGELYTSIVNANGVLIAAMNWSIEKRVIVKQKWKWPDWIKPGTWIMMNKSGRWCLSTSKPFTLSSSDSSWTISPSGTKIPVDIFLNVEMPECSDWTQSLMQKP